MAITAKLLVKAAVLVMVVLVEGDPNLLPDGAGGVDTGAQECSINPGLPLQVKLNNGVSGTSCRAIRLVHVSLSVACSLMSEELSYKYKCLPYRGIVARHDKIRRGEEWARRHRNARRT